MFVAQIALCGVIWICTDLRTTRIRSNVIPFYAIPRRTICDPYALANAVAAELGDPAGAAAAPEVGELGAGGHTGAEELVPGAGDEAPVVAVPLGGGQLEGAGALPPDPSGVDAPLSLELDADPLAETALSTTALPRPTTTNKRQRR